LFLRFGGVRRPRACLFVVFVQPDGIFERLTVGFTLLGRLDRIRSVNQAKPPRKTATGRGGGFSYRRVILAAYTYTRDCYGKPLWYAKTVISARNTRQLREVVRGILTASCFWRTRAFSGSETKLLFPLSRNYRMFKKVRRRFLENDVAYVCVCVYVNTVNLRYNAT